MKSWSAQEIKNELAHIYPNVSLSLAHLEKIVQRYKSKADLPTRQTRGQLNRALREMGIDFKNIANRKELAVCQILLLAHLEGSHVPNPEELCDHYGFESLNNDINFCSFVMFLQLALQLIEHKENKTFIIQEVVIPLSERRSGRTFVPGGGSPSLGTEMRYHVFEKETGLFLQKHESRRDSFVRGLARPKLSDSTAVADVFIATTPLNAVGTKRTDAETTLEVVDPAVGAMRKKSSGTYSFVKKGSVFVTDKVSTTSSGKIEVQAKMEPEGEPTVATKSKSHLNSAANTVSGDDIISIGIGSGDRLPDLWSSPDFNTELDDDTFSPLPPVSSGSDSPFQQLNPFQYSPILASSAGANTNIKANAYTEENANTEAITNANADAISCAKN